MTLARMLAARGDLLGCARELHRVPYWSSRKSDAVFREAQAYLAADHARDAEAALLAILDDDPLHRPDPGVYHDASQELLKIYAAEDRWEDAYGIIWKAYRPRQRRRTGRWCSRCGSAASWSGWRRAETIKVLRRYIAADPADFEALRALAKAELALGERAEAVRDMEACLRARPEDPRAWRDYLTMLQTLGEQDAFDAAMARVPPVRRDRARDLDLPRPGQGTRRRLEGRRRGLSQGPRAEPEPEQRPLPALRDRGAARATASRPPPTASGGRTCARRAQPLPQAAQDYQAALAAAVRPEPRPSAVADLRASTDAAGCRLRDPRLGSRRGGLQPGGAGL